MIRRQNPRSALVLFVAFHLTWVLAQNNNSTTDDDSSGTNTGSSGRDRSMDLFNYDTNQHTAQYFNFGPEDWGDIRCPDKDTCVSTKS